jgi:hypothetical protein
MECPHCLDKNHCVECNPKLADDVRFCNKCLAGTWHKNAKCLRCGTDNSKEEIIFLNI